MSILDRAYEPVIVFPQVEYTDADGNRMTRASSTGVPALAVVQVSAASGTAARRSEQDNEGFESEENYRIRFKRSFPLVLGAQSKLEWRGQLWSLVGEPRIYRTSGRTAHTDYLIRRA